MYHSEVCGRAHADLALAGGCVPWGVLQDRGGERGDFALRLLWHQHQGRAASQHTVPVVELSHVTTTISFLLDNTVLVAATYPEPPLHPWYEVALQPRTSLMQPMWTTRPYGWSVWSVQAVQTCRLQAGGFCSTHCTAETHRTLHTAVLSCSCRWHPMFSGTRTSCSPYSSLCTPHHPSTSAMAVTPWYISSIRRPPH